MGIFFGACSWRCTRSRCTEASSRVGPDALPELPATERAYGTRPGGLRRRSRRRSERRFAARKAGGDGREPTRRRTRARKTNGTGKTRRNERGLRPGRNAGPAGAGGAAAAGAGRSSVLKGGCLGILSGPLSEEAPNAKAARARAVFEKTGAGLTTLESPGRRRRPRVAGRRRRPGRTTENLEITSRFSGIPRFGVF